MYIKTRDNQLKIVNNGYYWRKLKIPTLFKNHIEEKIKLEIPLQKIYNDILEEIDENKFKRSSLVNKAWLSNKKSRIFNKFYKGNHNEITDYRNYIQQKIKEGELINLLTYNFYETNNSTINDSNVFVFLP